MAVTLVIIKGYVFYRASYNNRPGTQYFPIAKYGECEAKRLAEEHEVKLFAKYRKHYETNAGKY